MKTTFDVEDLRTIRKTAQEFLRHDPKMSNRRAVGKAKKAVRRMKKYFNK